MRRARLRAALERALRAESLTTRRFMALAVVSALATAVVIANAFDTHRALAQIVAAAEAARTPVVKTVSRPAPRHAVSTPASIPNTESSASTSQRLAPSTPSAPAAGSAPSTTPTTRQKQSTPQKTPASKPVSKIKHVFVLALGGTDGAALWNTSSPAPWLSGTLRSQGTLLTGYRPLAGAGDLASLIALTSGQPPTKETAQNCAAYVRFAATGKPDKRGALVGSGCIYPDDMLTLPDQLTIARHTWRGYFEDMSNDAAATKSCRRPVEGGPDDTQAGRSGDEYAADHNPFVYYGSLVDLGDCQSNDVPLDQLTTDLQSEKTTPSFVFVAPNLCHGGWEATCADGEPGGAATADAFARQWAQAILDSPAYKKDGLLIVLFGTVPAGTAPPGALLVSRFAKAGGTDDKRLGPYALLRGIEDVFGLTHLGHAGERGLGALPVTN